MINRPAWPSYETWCANFQLKPTTDNTDSTDGFSKTTGHARSLKTIRAIRVIRGSFFVSELPYLPAERRFSP